MILTNAECTVCREMVALSVDRLELPFVCSGCQGIDQDFTTQEYVDMAPATKPEPTEPTEPTEEFASVENTTLLIEDLESQLAQERRISDSFASIIDSLQARNDAQQKIVTAGVDFTIKVQEHSRDLTKKVLYFETLVPQLRADIDRIDAERRAEADLSDQYHARNQDQAATIKRLTNDNDVLLGEVLRGAMSFTSLRDSNSYLAESVGNLSKKLALTRLEVCDEQNRAKIEKSIAVGLQSSLGATQSENIRLTQKLMETDSSREYWMTQTRYARRERTAEREKSLWQCFKDRYFDRLKPSERLYGGTTY